MQSGLNYDKMLIQIRGSFYNNSEKTTNQEENSNDTKIYLWEAY